MILCACELYRVNEVQEKAAWPPDEALNYICGKSGTQFDPVLADAFVWLVLHDPKVKKLFFSR